ncbi:uncharacterized protein TRIADDRAFT_22290, partial [Trichoplax adhaerens]
DISEVTGVPMDEMATRIVRIYKPARNAMQSGTYATRLWILDFDNQERWENPLMGWASSADPVSNVYVQFDSKEEAIAFAEKNGWTYTVDSPQLPTMVPKTYGANFSWNKKTRVSTK